ncbi:DUF1801 domain-containing protein [Nocardioides sp. Kera G14]|uniref:DUF1801 domain-containing protein n=1 Tax=Nocardioides sp. Kera G14 TaxID=2884264 RepID=UPI001D1021FD|nr:DUF1801 domain-containing protein [Nocardioides sp. Kera G14]UDY22870.1 DUF1801 domain-containing protein [Nocardioides sp. Kera G14]
MPAPKVASVEEFFERLEPHQLPHLTQLRELSLAGCEGTELHEALKYNFPAYAGATMAWTLQSFKNHCAIRFPVLFFAQWKEKAAATGLEAIEGSLKFRWDQEIPEALVAEMIAARVADYQAGNTAWSVPGQYDGKKK